MIAGIEHCDTFIIFGSRAYGEDTGNSACTYYESKFALDRKKRIILIRASVRVLAFVQLIPQLLLIPLLD